MPMKTVIFAVAAALSLVWFNAAAVKGGNAPRQEGNAFNSMQSG
jgi:hypothetical protein